jgi:hypothetical protein
LLAVTALFLRLGAVGALLGSAIAAIVASFLAATLRSGDRVVATRRGRRSAGRVESSPTERRRAMSLGVVPLVLGVDAAHVGSGECAQQMAEAAQRGLGADVGVGITGVAGPAEQDDQPVGTVWYAIAVPGHETEAVSARLPGDRERIRQFSTISVLNLLRLRLSSLP